MKKIVAITGASSGIGKSTAKLLLKNHFIVYGGARRIEKMKDLEDMGARILKLDVTNNISSKKFINTIIQEQNRIDVLINNAGYGLFGPIEDIPLQEAQKQFDVNVFGLSRMTQLILPYMRAQHSGKVINISSIGGKIVTPFGGWYHATKFAVEALSDDLRMQTKNLGIDIIVIEPGGIKTEWDSFALNNLLKYANEPYKNYAKKIGESFKKSYKHASPPDVVARIILKSIKAKKPKTRYSVGSKAKLSLFVAKLPDRLRDWMLLKWMGV